ncbi:hypothetical protein ALC56_08947 [Trachymyrmex septentrionalis]|uniref:Uncharacterized protein n=1 Tax=Trachymyrmex septentrionalis TaxID=34720 RepID=A0A195F9V2_9HYME|nr:hypothetical protein ALC56_08947 [Trachymyrmex septentrionalis]
MHVRPHNVHTTRHSPAIVVPADMLIAVVTVDSVARRLTVSSRRGSREHFRLGLTEEVGGRLGLPSAYAYKPSRFYEDYSDIAVRRTDLTSSSETPTSNNLSAVRYLMYNVESIAISETRRCTGERALHCRARTLSRSFRVAVRLIGGASGRTASVSGTPFYLPSEKKIKKQAGERERGEIWEREKSVSADHFSPQGGRMKARFHHLLGMKSVP